MCTTRATAAAAGSVNQNPCYDAVLQALFLFQFVYSFRIGGLWGGEGGI
jgi:hypothetical protein